jgi:probable phosphoglycerate mutase
MNSINLHYPDRRVLIVCHQVVVLCMRYILEELDEPTILKIDRQSEVLNCGICAFDFQPAELDSVPKLSLWNQAAPLEQERAPITSEPDKMTGTR